MLIKLNLQATRREFYSRHPHLEEKESWTIKKAEHPRIDGLELWCWRRLLRVPWTARKSNQSILKEDSLPTEPPQKPKNTGVGGLSLLQQIFPRNQTGLSCIAGGFFTS